jgi:SHS2 domain-containing protein
LEGYRFLEHMSDAFIEAWGPTIERAFAQAGIALFETMLNTEKITLLDMEGVTAQGHDEKELLYNWLEAILLKFEIDGEALGKFDVQSIHYLKDNLKLTGIAHGEPYDPDKHGRKVEVKGVTYHQMMIQREKDRVFLRFLLDL